MSTMMGNKAKIICQLEEDPRIVEFKVITNPTYVLCFHCKHINTNSWFLLSTGLYDGCKYIFHTKIVAVLSVLHKNLNGFFFSFLCLFNCIPLNLLVCKYLN